MFVCWCRVRVVRVVLVVVVLMAVVMEVIAAPGLSEDKLDPTMERELMKDPSLLREVLSCVSRTQKSKSFCYDLLQTKQGQSC